jgi:hypothetical protein
MKDEGRFRIGRGERCVIMVDLRTLEALLHFDPLPEDVKRHMIRLDDGDGVLDPFREERTIDHTKDSRRLIRSRGRS